MIRSLIIGGLVWLAFASLPTPARADPCGGELPTRPGEIFSGEVRYVGDGDSLCVGRSDDPRTWIEVRLADFDAPELQSAVGAEAKTALERVALRQYATCSAVRGRQGRVRVYDRVIGLCHIRGRSVGALLRQAGAREGGR